jgi:hypothetical protein
MPNRSGAGGAGSERARAARRARAADVLLAALVGLAAVALALDTARALGPGLTLDPADSVWFEADSPGYFAMMTDRAAYHLDTRTHPLFSLLTWPFVTAIAAAGGVDRFAAATVWLAAIGAAWGAAIYLLLRRLGTPAWGSVLFSGVALATSTARFWLGVPETYLLGSVGILAMLAIAAGNGGEGGEVATAVGSAATLAVTITNWTAGWAATFLRFPWRRAVRITANAFVAVVLLWGVEKAIFPSAEFFLTDWHEGQYVLDRDSLGPGAIARSFFVHSAVAPEHGRVDRYKWSHLTLTTQGSALGSGGAWGVVATASWLLLLAAGVARLTRRAGRSRARIVLLAALAAQFAFHLLFGEETFLYAPHWLPMLVAVAALGLETRMRPLVAATALLFVVSAGIDNQRRFAAAAGEFRAFVAALPPEGPHKPRVPHRHRVPQAGDDAGAVAASPR